MYYALRPSSLPNNSNKNRFISLGLSFWILEGHVRARPVPFGALCLGGSDEAGRLVRGFLFGSGIGTFCRLNTNELTIIAGIESAA